MNNENVENMLETVFEVMDEMETSIPKEVVEKIIRAEFQNIEFPNRAKDEVSKIVNDYLDTLSLRGGD